MKFVIKNIKNIVLMLIVISIIFLFKVPESHAGPDEIITEGQDFISAGAQGDQTIDGNKMKEASDMIYNILLSVAVVASVAVASVLGLQFMFASVEDKAKIKESLIPFITGCIVVFGSFGIWKLAVKLLSQID